VNLHLPKNDITLKNLNPNLMKKLLISGAVALLLSCSDEKLFTDVPENGNFSVEEAYPSQVGQRTTYSINGVDYSVAHIKGNHVLEGDILLSEDQLHNTTVHTEGVGLLNRRWPGGIVYYSISSSLPSQNRVTDAIAHWQANTSIRFVRRTNQSNYVVFRTGSGCSSSLGMIGGVQYINLASGCSTGNTIHEIGHALGLFHEQSALARDNYINVNWSNIQSGYEGNFYKASNAADYSTFDFGSIMMYGSYAFSSNGQPTLVRKDGTTWNAQRNGLSSRDIQAIDAMY
jgi:hypothetical protein